MQYFSLSNFRPVHFTVKIEKADDRNEKKTSVNAKIFCDKFCIEKKACPIKFIFVPRFISISASEACHINHHFVLCIISISVPEAC